MAEWNGVELEGLVLHSGRLTLRPWQPSDVDTVAGILAEPRMLRYLPLPNPYTREHADAYVNRTAPSRAADGTGIELAVCENTTARVLGAALLLLEAGGESGEIGYWIGLPDWGQGFATEAAATLTRFAFSNGIRRLVIRCDTPNAASARVALALGFRFEAIQRGAIVRGRSFTGALFARIEGDGGAIAPVWPRLESVTDGTVLVRPMTVDDWPVILADRNNDEAMRWSLTGEPTTEEAARDEAGRSELDWLVSPKARFVICDASSGEPAGSMYVLRSGPPDVGLVGYGVAPAFRGRGFTTRALRLLSDWVFSNTSIGRLELGHKIENVASGKAALNAGFQREATLAGRLRNPDGSFSDEYYYGLTRPS